MDMAALFGFFSLLLVLAAALDQLAPTGKIQSAILEKVGDFISRRRLKINASERVDKYFGVGLYGLRQIFLTVLLSISSMIVTLSVINLMNPDTFLSIKANFSETLKSKYWFVLPVFFVANIFADFFSYAQTRVFMRVLDGTKSFITATILLISDFFASVLFFAVFFAFGSILCLSFIKSSAPDLVRSNISFVPQLFIDYDDQFLGALSEEAGLLEEYEDFTFSGIKKSDYRNAFLLYKEDNNAFLEIMKNATNVRELGENGYLEFNIEVRCLQATNIDNMAIQNTVGLLSSGQPTLYQTVHSALALELFRTEDNTCLDVISFEYEPDLKGLLHDQSLYGMYASYFNTAILHALAHIEYKFVTYIELNFLDSIFSSTSDAYQSSKVNVSDSREDTQSQRQVSANIRKMSFSSSEMAYVPFTLLLNSTIGASIVFWLYLLLNFISKTYFWALQLIRSLLEGLNIQDHLFLGLASTAVLFGLGLFVGSFAVSFLFDSLKQLLF